MSPMVPQQQSPSPMPPPQATSPAVCPPQAPSPMGPPQAPSPMGPPSMSPGIGGPPPGPNQSGGMPPNLQNALPNMHHGYNSPSQPPPPPPQGWQGNPAGTFPPNNYNQHPQHIPNQPSPGISPGPPSGPPIHNLAPNSQGGPPPNPPISSSSSNVPNNAAPLPSSAQGHNGTNQLQESMRELQKAISTMEEKGMQNDPRYSELIAMRAKYTGMVSNPNAVGPPPNGIPSSAPYGGAEGQRPPSGPLSVSQMYQLRAQIMAYRCIARNHPIPANICNMAQGRRHDQDPGRPPVAPGPQPPSTPPCSQPGAPPPNMQYTRHPGPPGQDLRKLFSSRTCCQFSFCVVDITLIPGYHLKVCNRLIMGRGRPKRRLPRLRLPLQDLPHRQCQQWRNPQRASHQDLR